MIKVLRWKVLKKKYVLCIALWLYAVSVLAVRIQNISVKREPLPEKKFDGRLNAIIIRDICNSSNYTKTTPKSFNERSITVRLNKDNNMLLCPIYKIGTTFWRRIFMMDNEQKYHGIVNPYELPFDQEYRTHHYSTRIAKDSYKFMFSRDPYSRLFSFYVDKLLAPNPVYWKLVGLEISKYHKKEFDMRIREDEIRFNHLVTFVVHSLSRRYYVDPHWAEMEALCKPCRIHYDFIGKMEESFTESSTKILIKMGLNKTAEFLRIYGKEEAAVDAIKDTLKQPFSFRDKYNTFITFQQAVSRSWTKLQSRGLVGIKRIEESAAVNDSITYDQLVTVALQSRANSSTSERQRIQREFYRNMWSQVDTRSIFALKYLYARDFTIFGYSDEPDRVFQGRKLNDTELDKILYRIRGK